MRLSKISLVFVAEPVLEIQHLNEGTLKMYVNSAKKATSPHCQLHLFSANLINMCKYLLNIRFNN
jgi:hypothetical protein